MSDEKPTKDSKTNSIFQVSKRRFLQGVSASAAILSAPGLIKSASAHRHGPHHPHRPPHPGQNSELFSLGVVSGDPSSNSVVLWTRLAPDPLNGGGMPSRPVRVHWEIATDPNMHRIIKRGAETARPESGHAVHAEVRGLPSNRWFYYRFTALGGTSRIGRTRTFPSIRDRHINSMRFAVANCQNYEQGFYPAYADMLEQNLDFILHVGDYIYESGVTSSPIAEGRVHNSGEIITVDDYRNRYALHRLDKNLQDAHAMYPFIVTWDDHEVDNNYAGLIAEENAPAQNEEFAQRRRNAYQVYGETMPLRWQNRRMSRRDGGLQLFRKLQFGRFADIHLLDTRQFRTDQPAGDGFGSTDPNSLYVEPLLGEELYDEDGIQNPQATMLGHHQEHWLQHNLRKSRAKWNILAQQVMITPWNLVKTGKASVAGQLPADYPGRDQILAAFDQVENILNVDAWDGYQAARSRLFNMLDRIRPNNPVVISGDIHSAWAAHLLKDNNDPNSDLLAAEFVSTSISSTFLGIDPRPTDYVVRLGLEDNPQIKFFNGLFRGYCLCEVNNHQWKTTFRAVGSLADTQNPDPLALVPFENKALETDAVITIDSGFNKPNSGKRMNITSRIPLA